MHQSARVTLRWVLGCLVIAAFALLGARAVRERRAREPAHELPVPAHASATLEDILSVESAAEIDRLWYLVDSKGHRIHVIDSLGALQRSIGRRGRGPGEFVAPTVVAANHAYTFVAELTRPEISVFDSAGGFVRFLRVNGACADGTVTAMSTAGLDLYVLRRCIELPARIRLQVERSRNGGPLTQWNVVADTIVIDQNGSVPIHVPLMAVDERRLVMGEGTDACLHVVRLPGGESAGQRCFGELSRQPMPPEVYTKLSARWGGRVQVPDSMPRVLAVGLRDTSIAVQIPETFETATWIELPWRARPFDRVRTLGRAAMQKSFLGQHSQLVIFDDVDGVRVEVIPLAR